MAAMRISVKTFAVFSFKIVPLASDADIGVQIVVNFFSQRAADSVYLYQIIDTGRLDSLQATKLA
jgi:hypothetical protein